jgi:5-methylcytosine-specific restriction endonuclease McrA
MTHSCAHWLNWQCGIALGAAREKVRVAHALEALPQIASAMERGELSYSKVRALTRVACPATEATLLNIALHGTAWHVEAVVREFRRIQEVAEASRMERQHEKRGLTYSFDDDGSVVIRLRLPGEQGSLLLKALDAADEQTLQDVPAGTTEGARPSFAKRRADAIATLAESFLKHGAEALTGGERQQIVVHVDHSTLVQRQAGRCGIEGASSLSVEAARRLSCDSSVVRIIEDARGEPLDVGRKTRSIPPGMRRALNSRDQGCRFPGCTHQRYVDGHHVLHWADGGETKLANLVTLCRFHHRKVHEGGVRIERLDDGAWRFTRADGWVLAAAPPRRTLPLNTWMGSTPFPRTVELRLKTPDLAEQLYDASADYGTARGNRIDLLLPHRACGIGDGARAPA